MVAATVIGRQRFTDLSGAHTDQKEHQNLAALTGDGSLVSTTVYKATVDPASATDGVGETIQLTGCVGVVLGRSGVRTIINGNDIQDFTLTGYVQADGVIELRFQNESVATTNLASSTYYVIVDTVKAGL